MDQFSNDFVSGFFQLVKRHKRIQEEATARLHREHDQLQLDEIFHPTNLASLDSRLD